MLRFMRVERPVIEDILDITQICTENKGKKCRLVKVETAQRVQQRKTSHHTLCPVLQQEDFLVPLPYAPVPDKKWQKQANAVPI